MKKLIPRIWITLLGIALILMGVLEAVLGFAGASTPAVVTGIRREGGERADAVAGRYTYNISYTFTLPGGKEIHGYAKKIGSSIYLKAGGASTVRVRYLVPFPYINAMESDTGLGAGQLVLILAGGLLVFVLNRRK